MLAISRSFLNIFGAYNCQESTKMIRTKSCCQPFSDGRDHSYSDALSEVVILTINIRRKDERIIVTYEKGRHNIHYGLQELAVFDKRQRFHYLLVIAVTVSTSDQFAT